MYSRVTKATGLRRQLPLMLALVATLTASPTRASIFDVYGFGARGTALGNAQTASAEDFYGVYYNPATLTVRKRTHFGFGLSLIKPLLTINRLNPTSGVATRTPALNLGVHLGVVFPIGGLLQNRLALAIGLFLPTIRLTRLESIDASTPHFYMYENLPDKLLVNMAVAYEIHRVISVGVGFQLLAKLTGTGEFSISLLERRINKKSLSVDLFATLAPTAGILIRPIPALRIGFSYRGALQLDFNLPLTVLLDEIGMLDFKIRGISLYTPHQLSVGISYDLKYPKIRFSAGLTWAMWSRAPSPAADIKIKLDDSRLNPGVDPNSIIDITSPKVKLNTKDILIPRVGIEYVMNEYITFRGGYFYRPTPVPKQPYETNYLDNEAHVVSLGIGFALHDKIERHRALLRIDLVGQLTVLVPRKVDKLQPNDPVGDYNTKGVILNFGLEFRHDF